jgi:cytoskeletal protein RodZ
MKTVGQILRRARLDKNFTVDQLSSLTKIDAKYIESIEADDYQKLPSETFAKGFIRNLGLRLEQNPDDLVAIFRRDFKIPIPTKTKAFRGRRPILSLSLLTSQIFLFSLGIIVFVGYLIFQFRAILTPPKLEVLRPISGSVIISPMEIEGSTTPDANITINDTIKAKPDQSGRFLVKVSLPVGETNLVVSVTNRFSRTSTQRIPITVVSQ